MLDKEQKLWGMEIAFSPFRFYTGTNINQQIELKKSNFALLHMSHLEDNRTIAYELAS